MEIAKNFVYVEYENDESSEDVNIDNLNDLMANKDLYTNVMQQLKGKDLLALCLSNSYHYDICSNQHFWKSKLDNEGVILYHEYQYMNYKYLYQLLYFIKYIVNDEMIDEETDYLVFRLDKHYKLDYYINLMIFLNISVDYEIFDYNDIKVDIELNTLGKEIKWIDPYYKRLTDNFRILFGIKKGRLPFNVVFRNITYLQIINFLFNCYIDGAIYEIDMEYD